jgi:PiT family inorganic phosphate transporter
MEFPILLIVIIALALIFDYINGFHDAANSIATIVSTKVLTPFQAVLWAALWNFAASLSLLISLENLKLVIQLPKQLMRILSPLKLSFQVLLRQLPGTFNMVVWYSFSSHTLIGGFLGAALMHAL